MAIVIEGGKKGFNWFGVALALLILILISVALYYFFFSPADEIIKIIPENVRTIKDISGNKSFNPDKILEDETFKILKEQISQIELTTSTRERINPFRP